MRTWLDPTRAGEVVVSLREDSERWEPVAADWTAARAVRAHVERHLGPVEALFVERRPDRVLITVLHVVRPETHVLVTCGMSSLPLRESADDAPRRAELVLGLPRRRSPPVGDAPGRSTWPVDLLTTLARHPHKARAGLETGRTVTHGVPPRPFGPDTPFCGALIRPPVGVPAGFTRFTRDDGAPVELRLVTPLLEDELRGARRLGSLVLLDQLEAAGVGLVADSGRRPVIGRGPSPPRPPPPPPLPLPRARAGSRT
ncbi:MAG: suppressor of fused domain protein [Planctomycetota bacterium JB042]